MRQRSATMPSEGSSLGNDNEPLNNAKKFNTRLVNFNHDIGRVLRRAKRRNQSYVENNSFYNKALLMNEQSRSGGVLWESIKQLTEEMPINMWHRAIGRGVIVDLNYDLRDVLRRHNNFSLMLGDQEAMRLATLQENEEIHKKFDNLEKKDREKSRIIETQSIEMAKKERDLERNKDSLKMTQNISEEYRKKMLTLEDRLEKGEGSSNTAEEVTRLKQEIAKLENENKLLLQENTTLRDEIANLNERVNNQFTEINKLQTDNNNKTTRIEALENDNSKKGKRIEALESDKTKKDSEIKELKNSEKTIQNNLKYLMEQEAKRAAREKEAEENLTKLNQPTVTENSNTSNRAPTPAKTIKHGKNPHIICASPSPANDSSVGKSTPRSKGFFGSLRG